MGLVDPIIHHTIQEPKKKLCGPTSAKKWNHSQALETGIFMMAMSEPAVSKPENFREVLFDWKLCRILLVPNLAANLWEA